MMIGDMLFIVYAVFTQNGNFNTNRTETSSGDKSRKFLLADLKLFTLKKE